MQSNLLGLVTCRQFPRLTASDSLLIKPLTSLGFQIKAVPWDDEKVRWEQFDTLILRSCWNYHLVPEKFLSWLDLIEKQGIKLWNPYKIVRWNINKKYLFDLKKKGIDIVPTKLINSGKTFDFKKNIHEFNTDDLIIKPVIGASAYGVKRISKNTKFTLPAGDYLVQPFLKEIYDGEYSLIFFNKKFSHAVIKIPNAKDFRTQPELGGTEKLIQPDKKIIKQAQIILEKIDSPLLYARVDGLLINGKFILMELELIEPHLFLDLLPRSAGLPLMDLAVKNM